MSKYILELAETAMTEIINEFQSATERYGQFGNMHEGYAVILEESDELWDCIKENRWQDARKEAVQVGAMALRFIVDCCCEEQSQ